MTLNGSPSSGLQCSGLTWNAWAASIRFGYGSASSRCSSRASTQVVLVHGEEAGSIAVRADESSLWIEHFYLRPGLQGRGVGSAVLKSQLASGTGSRPFRLNVLQGSRARALYERHGFVVEREDAVDVFMVRHVS